MYILASKFRFLEFCLLLSRVAPYYSSLPRTVGFMTAILVFGADLWGVRGTREWGSEEFKGKSADSSPVTDISQKGDSKS